MSAATQKGNQYEIEVRKYWESQGWIVFRQHRKPMFMNGRMLTIGADIFGCDMVCRKKGSRLVWLQVATDGALSAKKKQVLQFPWNLTMEDVEIWLRVKGKKEYRRYVLQNTMEFVEAPRVEVKNVPAV